jgi:hypothetical protein
LKQNVGKREATLRRAQGERKKSFENNPPTAQAEPFDGAQDMLVEASSRRKSTVPWGEPGTDLINDPHRKRRDSGTRIVAGGSGARLGAGRSILSPATEPHVVQT